VPKNRNSQRMIDRYAAPSMRRIASAACAAWAGASLLLWAGASRADDATIYARLEKDGSLTFSNVPVDRRYAVLIGDGTRPVAGPVAPAAARLAPFAQRRGVFSGIIERMADQYGLESALLHAVIATESGYDPAARSPKGAGGLMQLMPETARRYGVIDSFDPEQNIEGGARYLRDLLQMFGSDLSLALAAYNAGEGAVKRNQNRIPNIRETLDYVPKVLAHYRKNKGLHAH
jgi:soluble lytic murein transglycosylase-like protein